MPRINLNQFAKELAGTEGGKVNLPIAQIKEVLRITLKQLSVLELQDVIRLLEEAKKK